MKHLYDYHVHSDVSGDSKVPMEEQVERALELGLKEICFTEHLDFDPLEYDSGLARPGHPRDGFLNEEYYDAKFETCQKKYGHRIRLLQGVEAGELHRFPEQARAIIAAHDYDFIIGSVHNLYGFSLSSPWPETDTSMSADLVYQDFFAQVQGLALCDDFDVVGHLDIVKRHSITLFGPFDARPYRDVIEQILRTLIHRGKGIEINTSGLRQKPQETMPGLAILTWYRELGGEILTFGSDGHRPEYLGFGLNDARELALTAGLRYFTTFDKRKPTFQKIV